MHQAQLTYMACRTDATNIKARAFQPGLLCYRTTTSSTCTVCALK